MSKTVALSSFDLVKALLAKGQTQMAVADMIGMTRGGMSKAVARGSMGEISPQARRKLAAKLAAIKAAEQKAAAKKPARATKRTSH